MASDVISPDLKAVLRRLKCAFRSIVINRFGIVITDFGRS
jgi:hypothetical protein